MTKQKNEGKKLTSKGLSDSQLSAKYDSSALAQKSFDKTLKNMTAAGSALSQAKKKK